MKLSKINLFAVTLLLVNIYLFALTTFIIIHGPQSLDIFWHNNKFPDARINLSLLFSLSILLFLASYLFTIVKKTELKTKNLIYMIIVQSIILNYDSIINNLGFLKINLFNLNLYSFLSFSQIFQEVLFCGLIVLFLITFFENYIRDFRLSPKKEIILLSLLFIFGGVIYSLISVYRHLHFGSSAMDLGLYDQAIWGFSHFQLIDSTVYLRHFNALGDHFEPVLILIAPIYWIYHNVIGLLIFQAVSVASTVWPLYLLAKSKLKSQLASYLIALSFLIFIGVIKAIGFDFHPLVLIAPVLTWMIYFLQKDKNKWFYVMMILALLIKETVGLYVIFIGIYALLRKKYYPGLIAIASGIAWYLLTIKLFIPKISHEAYAYLAIYNNLGKTNFEVLKTIVSNPPYIFHVLTTPALKIENFLSLFAATGFLSFLSPLALVMALPMLGEKFLSADRAVNWQMQFHYNISIAPIIFFSAILAIAYLSQKIKLKNVIIYGAIFIFLNSFLITFIYYRGNEIYSLLRPTTYTLSTHERQLNKIMQKVPLNSSITTQDHLLPHLSHRKEIYRLGMNLNLQSDYVLIDPLTDSWPYTPSELNNFVSIYRANPNYQLIENIDNIYLFKKSQA